MVERALLDSRSPITQSIEAVKSLLAYVGRASDPLPTSLELPDKRCILVLSNKKDVYYNGCSCPSAAYRPGKPCKHQRKYFPEPTKAGMGYTRPMTMAETLEDHERRLPNLPKSYQRMVELPAKKPRQIQTALKRVGSGRAAKTAQ